MSIPKVLEFMKSIRVSVSDLLAHITDTNNSACKIHRQRLYDTPENGGRLSLILDQISASTVGCKQLDTWALKRTCWVVGKEMDGVKAAFSMTVDEVTPEFLTNWSFSGSIEDVIKDSAPTLMKILLEAAQTGRARDNNTIKDPWLVCPALLSNLEQLSELQ
jgi:hypothetical protein